MSEAVMCDVCKRTFPKAAEGPQMVKAHLPQACLPEDHKSIGIVEGTTGRRIIDVCGGCQEAMAVTFDRLVLDRFGSTAQPVETPLPRLATTD